MYSSTLTSTFTPRVYSNQTVATSHNPNSELLLRRLRNSTRFAKRVDLHRAQHPVDRELVNWLPYAALEPKVLSEYNRQGEDFVAFCVANNLQFIPISYHSLTAYFYDHVKRGKTARSFRCLSSKIKWYIINVLHGEWIDTSDPVGYAAFLQARRAMSKLDLSLVSKKAPLYLAILLKFEQVISPMSVYEEQLMAIFSLQHACMQRLGELVGGTARRRNVRRYSHPSAGAFFAFFYFEGNKPKMHKVKQAPFAVVSQRNNPLAFKYMSRHLARVHKVSTPSSFLFYHVNKEDKIIKSRSLSFGGAVDGLKSLIAKVGLNPAKYGGQSARRGGFLDKLHVPLNMSQTQGHWSVGSVTTMQEYGHQGLSHRLRFF